MQSELFSRLLPGSLLPPGGAYHATRGLRHGLNTPQRKRLPRRMRKHCTQPRASWERGAHMPSLCVTRRAQLPEVAAEADFRAAHGCMTMGAAPAHAEDAAAGRGALTLDPGRVFLRSGCIGKKTGAARQGKCVEKALIAPTPASDVAQRPCLATYKDAMRQAGLAGSLM